MVRGALPSSQLAGDAAGCPCPVTLCCPAGTPSILPSWEQLAGKLLGAGKIGT